ncbi:MAG: MFS transporter [Planctomycetota bacterium]
MQETDDHDLGPDAAERGGRHRRYYGWLLVPVASLMVVGTLPGQTVVVSQFNTSIRESLGLTNESLAFAYLIGTVAAALPLTLVGRLSDRIGPRRTSALVVGALLLGIMWLSNARGVVALTLGFFFVRFLGQGALGMLSSHVLALWFERRLATVESIKHGSLSAAGALVPAVVLWLIDGLGWRQAYAVLGVAVAASLLPLIAFVLRDRPADVGQSLADELPGPRRADRRGGDNTNDRTPGSVETTNKDQTGDREVAFTLGETLGSRSFWLLLAPGVLSGLVGTAMLFHIQPILAAGGLGSPERAGAAAVSWWSIAMFIGLMTGGPTADRVAPRVILPISTAGVGLSAWLLSTAGAPMHAAAAMGVFGIAQGWGMAAAGPAIARFFGRPHHGAIRGFATTAMVAGTAVGPWLLTATAAVLDMNLQRSLLACVAISVPVAIGAGFAVRPTGLGSGHAESRLDESE